MVALNVNADSENQSSTQYERFGPVPWMSIILSGLLSITLAVGAAIHTTYKLGLYNNYWEEIYFVGAFFSIVVSIIGPVLTNKRVFLVDQVGVLALLCVYSILSSWAFMFLLHVRETQIVWIIPMWMMVQAIPLACISTLRIGFTIARKMSLATKDAG
jgi:hypothetical protein